MSKRKQLQDKKADLVAKLRGIADAAAADGRDLSESEAKSYQGYKSDLVQVNAALDREAELMEFERGLEAGAAAGGNGASAGAAASAEQPATAQSPKPKFASLGDQLQAVVIAAGQNGVVDNRLVPAAASAGQNTKVGEDGGFLVEPSFATDLLTNVYKMGDIASRLRRLPSTKSSQKIKAVNETSRANGSRWGGVRAYWQGEAKLLTESQIAFRDLELKANKLTGLCYSTSEMLDDAPFLEAVIDQAFQEEFTFQIEDKAMNGTGVEMPLGWMNSGAVVTQAKEGSQAAATIVAMNIVKMFSRLPARNRKNAVWLINQEAEPQLYPLQYVVKNVAGTENVGGYAAPIYIPPGTAGNEFGLLLGKPVIPVEYCAALGTAGDIQLVDLSQYLLLDRKTLTKDVSMHVRFLYDEMAFRFILRADGQPVWNAPMTPYKGSATQSPFVMLENR